MQEEYHSYFRIFRYINFYSNLLNGTTEISIFPLEILLQLFTVNKYSTLPYFTRMPCHTKLSDNICTDTSQLHLLPSYSWLLFFLLYYTSKLRLIWQSILIFTSFTNLLFNVHAFIL